MKKLVRREQLSVLPPSLELLRKVDARATEGPSTRLGPLDVEAVVADWRDRRSG